LGIGMAQKPEGLLLTLLAGLATAWPSLRILCNEAG